MKKNKKVDDIFESKLSLNECDPKTLMLKLLEIDREEVKYWQRNISILSYGAILLYIALFNFIVKLIDIDLIMCIFYSLIVLIIIVSYFITAFNIKKVIGRNHYDLFKIQSALKLHEPDVYLKNETIYPRSGRENIISEWYIMLFIILNTSFGILLITLIWLVKYCHLVICH